MTTAAKPEEKKSTNSLVTPEFRVSFPSVFTAKPSMNVGGKPKFTVTMLFRTTANPDKPEEKVVDLNPLKLLVRKAIEKKWGADQTKWPKGLWIPLRDGSEKDYEGYDSGVTFAAASSERRPGLVDYKVQPIIEPNEFYAGCYARAKIDVYAFEAKDKNTGAVLKRGVSFGLINIQKLRDGEPFSNATKPENDFDAIEPPAGAAGAAGQPADPLAGL